MIWATGFRTDHAWIDVPVPDNRGRPVYQRGVTRLAGPVLPQADLATHPGLGAPGLGEDDVHAHRIGVGR